MDHDAPLDQINRLAHLIREIHGPLRFRFVEIGARPVKGQAEPFHELLEVFPGSESIAFEIDEKLCSQLNQKARPGLRYFPVALGHREETRAFYEAVHPMCSSLYRPNEELMRLYQNTEAAMLKSVGSVDTVSLDYCAREKGINDLDFIKIDIQGAELDVLRGAGRTLRDVVAIVTEVEFIPLYVDQPLFGDVCEFLAELGFMFHKFLGMAGHTLKPFAVSRDLDVALQHTWADALFTRHIQRLARLPSDKLLKLGVLALLYRSPDAASHCLRLFDERNDTDLSGGLLGSPG